MAEIKSESVADFIPESAADFARNMHPISGEGAGNGRSTPGKSGIHLFGYGEALSTSLPR
jgi:hypothetical protein